MLRRQWGRPLPPGCAGPRAGADPTLRRPSARHRRPRPRLPERAALRRPDLPDHRPRRGPDRDHRGHRPRCRGGLRRGLGRRGDHADHRSVPDRARHRRPGVGAAGARVVPDHDRAGPGRPRVDLHRPSGAGPGAVPAREGVRGRRPGDRRLDRADPAAAPAPQPGRGHRREHLAGHRRGDHRRVHAQLPRLRRPAAADELGQHAQSGRRTRRDRPGLPPVLPGPLHPAHRAEHQLHRRRTPRRPRPPGEAV